MADCPRAPGAIYFGTMPQENVGKRKKAEQVEDAEALKRAKPSVSAAAQELVCPISFELPIDPVIADEYVEQSRLSLV